jgi:hypothetical protein
MVSRASTQHGERLPPPRFQRQHFRG